jgi:hypothetical protein
VIDQDPAPPRGGELSPLGSYDDVPEAGVHVFLAVPLLAVGSSSPVTAQSARVRSAPLPVTRTGARHSRPRHSVVLETLLLGVTAAVVVLGGVVVMLSLVDWLS